MGRKKTIIAWLLCSLMCLSACFPVLADNSRSGGGGTVPKRDGQTDIMAGVVVDYMGKLRFLVIERDNGNPIPGASVEIFIPSLNRYVLFGITDSNGIYELDVAHNMNPSVSDGDQFDENNGEYTFSGSMIYLSDNNIQYRVYKAGWLDYPHDGSHTIEGKTVPETVTIRLYQKKDTDDSGGDDKDPKPTQPDPSRPNPGDEYSGGGGATFVDKLLSILDDALPLGGLGGTGTNGLPKTGVEGALHYWAFGLIFFLVAAVAIWRLLKSEKESKETKKTNRRV